MKLKLPAPSSQLPGPISKLASKFENSVLLSFAHVWRMKISKTGARLDTPGQQLP